MKKIELLKSGDEKFSIKLTLTASRAGEVEFLSIFPNPMSQSEAEARLIRLSEIYGFEREHLPYKNASDGMIKLSKNKLPAVLQGKRN